MNAQIQNPYPGPESFERNDSRPFFGREQETRDLSPMIVTQRLLVYYAPSGAGKTSLLNKRLIPRLEEKLYEVLPRGRVSGVSALPDAVENVYAYNLMLRLAPNDPDPQRFADLTLSDFLWRLTTEDGRNYTYDPSDQALRKATPHQNLWPRVLVLDQFEEIVTSYPAYWQHREGFFRQLNDALVSDPMLRVVICLRSDFVQDLERYAGLLEQGLRARYQMFLMNKADALNAIEGPAAEYGRPFAPGVASRLVANLSQVRDQHADGTIYTVPGESVEPIQLQVVCYQLWESLRDAPGDRITMADLARLARASLAPPADHQPAAEDDEDKLLAIFVDGALRAFYERALDNARNVTNPPFDEAYLRSWFSTQLITENGARGFLQRGHEETAGVPDTVVQSLVDGHLLRSDTRGSVRLVELIHDRFVDPIREANLVWNERRRREQPWIDTAYRWYESGASHETRDATILLLGAALKAVLEEKGQRHLEPILEEYLDACEAEQAHREQQSALALERRKTEEAQRLAEQEARTARQLNRQKKWLAALAGIALVSLAVALILAFILDGQRRTLETTNDDLTAAKAEVEDKNKELDAANDELTEKSLKNQSILLAYKSSTSSAWEDALLLARAALNYTYTLPAQGALLDALEDVPRVVPEPLGDLTDAWVEIAYSGDGELMALGGSGGSILLAHRSDGQTKNSLLPAHGSSEVSALALNTAGTQLASAGSNLDLADSPEHNLILWDVSNPSAPISRTLMTGQPSIFSVAFSPDDRTLATANYDGRVDLWDLSGPEPISRTLPGSHAGWAFALDFSPDGKQLASGGKDGTVILWNLDGRASISQTLTDHTEWVNDVAFSPDGTQLASASDDGTIRLWDLTREQPTSTVISDRSTEGAEGWSVEFNPENGAQLAVGWGPSGYGALLLYDLAHPYSLSPILSESTDAIWSAQFDPSDPLRLVFVDEYGTAPKVAELGTQAEFGAREIVNSPAHLQAYAAAPNGAKLAAMVNEELVVFSLLADHAPITRSIPYSLTALALSDDGTLVAAAGCMSAIEIPRLPGESDELAGDCTLSIIPLEQTGEIKESLVLTLTNPVRALAFHPDRPMDLAVGFESGEVQSLNLHDPEAHAVLPGSVPAIADLAFGDRGELLAGLARNGRVLVWKWDDREFLYESEAAANELEGTPGAEPANGSAVSYSAIDFANQDNWLAIISSDSYYGESKVTLWEWKTPEKVVTLEPGDIASSNSESNLSTELVYDPAREELRYIHDDQFVRWPLDEAKLLELACAGAGRNLEYRAWLSAFPGETDYELALICRDHYPLHASFAKEETAKATRVIDDCTAEGLDKGMEMLRKAAAMPVDSPLRIDPVELALRTLSDQALEHLASGTVSDVTENDAFACLERAAEVLEDAGEPSFDPAKALKVGKSLLWAQSMLAGSEPGDYGEMVDELEFVYGHQGDWPGQLVPDPLALLQQAYFGLCNQGDAHGCKGFDDYTDTLEYGVPQSPIYTTGVSAPRYFRGEQGDIVVVGMSSTVFDPLLTVSGPEELELTNDDSYGSSNSVIEFEVPQDGYYRVLPGAFSGEGAYRLTLDRFTPTALELGGPVDATSQAAIYWYFDGRQGDAISVTVVYSDSSFAPYIALLRPDLSVIADATAIVGSTGVSIPPQFVSAGGRYLLKVMGADARAGNGGRDYPYQLHAALAELPSIAVGDSVTSTSKTNTIWAIGGQPGQVIDIAMTADPNTGFDPVIDLLGSDGATIAWNDDYGGTWNSLISGFVLTRTTPYYLRLGRPDSDVPYTLTVGLTPAHMLLPGQTVVLTQTEVVTFEAVTGDTFVLHSQPETTMALVGAGGASAVQASAFMTQLTATEVISVLVGPSSYGYTTTVRLDRMPDDVDSVPIGMSSVRELAGSGVDFAAFTAITETGIAISITPAVGGPVMDLFDPSGTHLAHVTMAPMIQALPVAGDYLLMVHNPDVASTGAFTVSLAAADVVPVPQACTPGAQPDYGPVRMGSAVILGRHRPVNGDANWDASMQPYVGMKAIVTGLADADGAGCPAVWVDVDGSWRPWRIRDMTILR